MSMGEMIAGVSGLKTVMDTLKGFKDINDASVRNTIAIELQGKILAAYQDQLALIEKVGTLEKEVATLKNWEAEKAQYELKDVGSGSLAYVPKQGEKAGEPTHNICANCYSNEKKSILQKRQHSVGRVTTLDCSHCKSYVVIWGVLPDGTKSWIF